MPWSQVSKYFHQVLDSLLLLAQHNVKIYDVNDNIPIPNRIAQDPKMDEFANCIGAIDGTLLPASVKGKDRRRDGKEGVFRCRKGWLAINVLGCVDFDMNFKLVWPGWEGSAHDATVLNNAIAKGKFKTPPRRVWLADAGYTLKDSYQG
jgi:hypothetical protein